MPFKSYEQEAYLKHNRPDIYYEWLKKYGHAKKKRKKSKHKSKKKK